MRTRCTSCFCMVRLGKEDFKSESFLHKLQEHNKILREYWQSAS